MDIAATVSNLIKHLLPNDDGRWVSSRWISDELSPLLNAIHSKDVQTAELAANNAEIGNTFAILLAVLATFNLHAHGSHHWVFLLSSLREDSH